MFELVSGIALAAAAVYFVLRPIISPLPEGGGQEERDGADDGDNPEDDFSPRAVALRALKEIEFDRATGKLTDADYDALKRKYTTEALVALRTGDGQHRVDGGHVPPTPIYLAERGGEEASVCPTHGPRPERDALFCSACGRRLAKAPGYCNRCGTALEPNARFCARCGVRVAA